MKPTNGTRLAGLVLYALLSGQILFGAAAVIAAATKDDGRPAPARNSAQVAIAIDVGAVVR